MVGSIAITKNTPIWVAFKGTAGFGFRYYGTSQDDYQTDQGRWNSVAISNDETEAYLIHGHLMQFFGRRKLLIIS